MSFSFITPRRLLASGLCLGVLSTFGLTIRSHSWLSPAVAEVAIASTKNVTADDVVGTWQGELAPGQMITWILTPDGKLFMTAPPVADEPQQALEMRYQVESSTKPMGLDIDLAQGATVMTIFEMTPEGQMLVQIAGTTPGEERPEEFNNATVFEKVSDTTTLPPNTQIDDFQSR